MSTGEEPPKHWRTDVTSLIWFTTLGCVIAAVIAAVIRERTGDIETAESAAVWLFAFMVVGGPLALVAALAIDTRGKALVGTAIGKTIGGLFGLGAAAATSTPGDARFLALITTAAIAGAWAGGGLHAARLGNRRIGTVATVMATLAVIPVALTVLYYLLSLLWKLDIWSLDHSG